MKHIIKIMGILALVAMFTASAFAGFEDRMSDIELKASPTNYADFPEISAPTGNPASGHGWLYVKDNGSYSDLYFEDDGGTVTELTATAATAYDDIGDPDADSSIAFGDNEILAWTFADTNEDMVTIQGLGAFGNVSVVRIEQVTGNPTDGTVLEVVSADANVDPLVVSSSGLSNALVVGQNAGAVSIGGAATVAGTLTANGTIVGDGATTMVGVSPLGEVVTAANILTAAECGSVYFLDADVEFQTTLPAMSTVTAGCQFEFYIEDAPSGADYTILTGNSDEDLLVGGVVEREVDTNDDGPYDASADTITFADGVSVEGDHVKVVASGNFWYVTGVANADGGITITDSD